jgi:hypothetical protein
MIPTANNDHPIFSHSIDKPVLLIDATRPAFSEVPSQWLRFPRSLEWGPLNLLDQLVNSFEFLLVRPLPVEVVLPSPICEDEVHPLILLDESPSFYFTPIGLFERFQQPFGVLRAS